MIIDKNPVAITNKDLDEFQEGTDYSCEEVPTKDQRTLSKELVEDGQIDYSMFPIDILECSFLPGDQLPDDLILY